MMNHISRPRRILLIVALSLFVLNLYYFSASKDCAKDQAVSSGHPFCSVHETVVFIVNGGSVRIWILVGAFAIIGIAAFLKFIRIRRKNV